MNADEIVRALRNCGGGPEGIKIVCSAADLVESLQAQVDEMAILSHAADKIIAKQNREIESLQAQLNDVVPVVHGEWILNEDMKWACSSCEGLAIEHPNKSDKRQAITAYCPRCGADNRGSEVKQ